MSEGGPALESLARDLDRSLAARGFGAADKRFSAHLTIGRVRQPGPDWTDRLAAASLPAGSARFTVDRIRVVESKLDPRGSIYTVRAEGLLGA
jgi:2'-5' RNA ligase